MPQTNQPALIDNATGAVLDETAEQAAADQASETLFATRENADKTGGLIASFVDSYSQNKNRLSREEWLNLEFAKYPNIWSSEAERQQTAQTIVATIQNNNRAKAELYGHLAKGQSRESWLAEKIEQGAASAGVANVGDYARGIDDTLSEANQQFRDTISTKGGLISQNPNLDGFIAEQHHVDTFNLDAAAKGSPYRAKVQGSNGKNSMDIGIYDENDKLVRRYQSKYSGDAESTDKLFEKGDYRGQRKLVPAGQGSEKSTEVIEIDGVSSKPLSKEAAKELQKKAQQDAEIKEYEWNDVNRKTIAKEIGKKALITAAFSAGFQGARILGRRLWNSLNGKENRPANEDLQEFFTASLDSTKNAGVQIAVSGAIVVAAKNGWITLLKNTPAGQITNMVYVGLENAKCLFKMAKGELSPLETLDAMGNNTCTAIGGLAGAAQGAVFGASIGTVLGPVGAAVGGFVGGVAGGIAGSGIGNGIYQAGKTIVKTAAKVVESAWEGAKEVARGVFNKLTFGLFG